MSNTPKIMSMDNEGAFYAILAKSNSSGTTGSVDSGWLAASGWTKQTSSSGVHIPKSDDDVMVLGTSAGTYRIYCLGSSDDWGIHIHDADDNDVLGGTDDRSNLPDNQQIELEVGSDGVPSITLE